MLDTSQNKTCVIIGRMSFAWLYMLYTMKRLYTVQMMHTSNSKVVIHFIFNIPYMLLALSLADNVLNTKKVYAGPHLSFHVYDNVFHWILYKI